MAEFNQWKEQEEEITHTAQSEKTEHTNPKMMVSILHRQILCDCMYVYM